MVGDLFVCDADTMRELMVVKNVLLESTFPEKQDLMSMTGSKKKTVIVHKSLAKDLFHLRSYLVQKMSAKKDSCCGFCLFQK